LLFVDLELLVDTKGANWELQGCGLRHLVPDGNRLACPIPGAKRAIASTEMYETFEHTADLGLRVRAADLNQLFVEAAQALFSAIVDDLATVEPKQRVDISFQGDDWSYLLFDWLNELLYRFDTEHLLFGKFEVRISSEPGALATGSGSPSLTVGALTDTVEALTDTIVASAWGEPLDRSRHSLAHEVKAITYHGLRVEKEGDGWLAEVIVDI